MKLPKRFALSTLLLMMLVVAMVFGYAQWRRLWVIREIKSLNEIGDSIWTPASGPPLRTFYTRSLPAITLRDGFWPTSNEERIPVCYFKNPGGTFSLAGNDETLAPDELRRLLANFQSRLHFIGVDTVEFWQYQETGMGLERKNATELDFID